MSEQFDRVVEVQVNDTLITDLDVTFEVVKDLSKEPNTASVSIFNLNPENRSKIEQASENPIVQISCGYPGNVGVIFLGDVRDTESYLENGDWITTLESGDGERTRFDRINQSFRAGTALNSVLTAIATSMNVGVGNLSTVLASAQLANGAKAFPNGVTISGQSRKQLDRMVRSAGLEWSIQDGQLQFLTAGQTLLTTAVVLSPQSGLVGSPRVGKDGLLSGRALLNSDIIPGRVLIVKSRSVNGRFRAERCEYKGSTFQNEFYVDFEATAL